MSNTKNELLLFIQDWIYHLIKSDKLTVFIGMEAMYDTKRKLYQESESEYKLVAEDISGLAEARQGDLYRLVVEEELDPQYGYQWRIISAVRVEPVENHVVRKFLTQIREKSLTHTRRDALIKAYGAKVFDAILTNPSALDVIKADPNSKHRIQHAIAEKKGFGSLSGIPDEKEVGLPLGDPTLQSV